MPKGESNISSFTTALPARSVVMTARRIRGNLAASGISSPRSRMRIPFTAGEEDAALFESTDGAKPGWTLLAFANTAPAAL